MASFHNWREAGFAPSLFTWVHRIVKIRFQLQNLSCLPWNHAEKMFNTLSDKWRGKIEHCPFSTMLGVLELATRKFSILFEPVPHISWSSLDSSRNRKYCVVDYSIPFSPPTMRELPCTGLFSDWLTNLSVSCSQSSLFYSSLFLLYSWLHTHYCACLLKNVISVKHAPIHSRENAPRLPIG